MYCLVGKIDTVNTLFLRLFRLYDLQNSRSDLVSGLYTNAIDLCHNVSYSSDYTSSDANEIEGIVHLWWHFCDRYRSHISRLSRKRVVCYPMLAWGFGLRGQDKESKGPSSNNNGCCWWDQAAGHVKRKERGAAEGESANWAAGPTRNSADGVRIKGQTALVVDVAQWSH